MIKLFNHKGIGLTELLGSIVIFGLVFSLVATLLTLFFASSKRIATIEKATTEGTLIIQTLESRMQSFAPTEYRTCIGENDCVILENHYSYEFDPQSNQIVLVVNNPIHEFSISIVNGDLLMDGVIWVIDGFEVATNSTITILDNLGDITITMQLFLVAPQGEIFSFTASHFFTTSTVPSA